jgi:hypothetical protein
VTATVAGVIVLRCLTAARAPYPPERGQPDPSGASTMSPSPRGSRGWRPGRLFGQPTGPEATGRTPGNREPHCPTSSVTDNQLTCRHQSQVRLARPGRSAPPADQSLLPPVMGRTGHAQARLRRQARPGQDQRAVERLAGLRQDSSTGDPPPQPQPIFRAHGPLGACQRHGVDPTIVTTYKPWVGSTGLLRFPMPPFQ